jgi:hypothetical protein
LATTAIAGAAESPPSASASASASASPSASSGAATSPRKLSGRGVYTLDTTQRCPLGGAGARGANACLRIALDDGDSTVEVDPAARRIVLRNSRRYPGKTIVGDMLILGSARAPSGVRVPVAVHLVIRKRGNSFDATPHAHAVTRDRPSDVEIDGYDVVVTDGAREERVLTPVAARDAIADPGLAARIAPARSLSLRARGSAAARRREEERLAKGKAVVFSMRGGKGRVSYGADSVDLPNAVDHARAFLEFSFLGAILQHRAALALAR